MSDEEETEQETSSDEVFLTRKTTYLVAYTVISITQVVFIKKVDAALNRLNGAIDRFTENLRRYLLE